jgi:hypothetical protein
MLWYNSAPQGACSSGVLCNLFVCASMCIEQQLTFSAVARVLMNLALLVDQQALLQLHPSIILTATTVTPTTAIAAACVNLRCLQSS